MDKKTLKKTFTYKPIEEKYQGKKLLFFGIGSGVTVAFVLGLLLEIIGTPLFNAKTYANQLPIETSSTEEFNENFNFDGDVKLPILDKDLAFKVAQSKLSTYGSQYTIDSDNFTILSVTRNGEDQLIRVAPLEYTGLFVALSRKEEGTIGYIEVNVVTKETKLVEVNGGLKYMPSGLLDKDLDRHIRFNYPSALFSEKYFEIDDEGKPYWVIPTYVNQICLFNGGMPNGTIIVDPVNGDINRYSIGEEPSWVDRVVLETLVESQATNALEYKNGFFNAVFGSKKDVFQTSDGYNYFIKNGHTYYVSCITSPNENDQTSIGFLTIDLKTREAKQYNIPGITEMRAREIAMQHEDVKAQQLEATWPILIDYKGIPTYFLVLKNDVQDRKIVLLDVETGAKIALGSTLNETKVNYDKLINASGNTSDTVLEGDFVVDRVQVYGSDLYFTVEGIEDKYFVVASSVSIDAMFLKSGDSIHLTYVAYESYNYVKTLTRS
ncbi:MAG: hypothetical protein WCR67_02915 [Bacilli bacterium]